MLTREDLDTKEQEWLQELEGAKVALWRIDGALAALRLLREMIDNGETRETSDQGEVKEDPAPRQGAGQEAD